MTIAEQIYELVKALPQDQAHEVLIFVEQIRAQYRSSDPSIDTTPPGSWEELVHSLAGSWGEDFPSLEEIRAESGQDSWRESL